MHRSALIRCGAVPLVAILAGVAQAAALAWWGNGQALWWLQIPALAVPVGLLLRLNARATSHMPETRGRWSPSWRAFGLGWMFATSWLCATFWWLFISMHVYGGLAAPLAVLAVLTLAAFLALYYGAACAGWFLLLSRTRAPGSARAAWWWPLSFAACWTLAEWARGTWLTGFPWGAVGYAHVDGPLASLAPWVGVYGMGGIAAWAAALLAALVWSVQALVSRSPAGSWRPLLASTASQAMVLSALLAGSAVLGLVHPGFTQATGELHAELLQGNIAQDEKFAHGPGIQRSLSWYGEALTQAKAPLVVTAETAIPVLPTQLNTSYWLAIRAPYVQSGGERAALVAIPLGSLETGYTNSLRAFAAGEVDQYRYDKHHLVPFGEFIPPGFRWFVRLMNIPLGDFERGALPQPPLHWRGQRIAPNICYEDLFGEEIGAGFRDPAQAPTVLLNVTNIAWFGDSIAIDQHLHISRLRALEFERPMLRATNTGTTAHIDHRGRMVRALPRLQAGVLEVHAQGREGRTPYAAWVAPAGLWPLVALCLGLIGTAVWRLCGPAHVRRTSRNR